jgi:PPOX class probable F420-dependent enzyme
VPALRRDEIDRRVRRASVATLGTIGDNGAPHLVPITFALVDDVLYSAVDHKPKRTRDLKRLSNIERDPRVSVLVSSYDDNWSKLWWCRLRGEASVQTSGEAFERGVGALTEKYEQYHRTRLRGPVIVITVTRASGWAAIG